MKSGYTHASILIDRSGSMSSIKEAIIKAFNDLIQEQLKEPGEMTVSLVQFDSAGGFITERKPNIRYETLNDFTPLSNVTLLTEENYKPDGGTPLNDCVVRIIKETGTKLSNIPETLRPEKVLVVIISDGNENSSVEFAPRIGGTAKVAEIVKHQEKNYNWKFIYIGANQDSAKEANSRGMTGSYDFTPTQVGVNKMSKVFSKTMSKIRGASMESYFTSNVTADMLQSDKEVDEENKLKS